MKKINFRYNSLRYSRNLSSSATKKKKKKLFSNIISKKFTMENMIRVQKIAQDES